MVRLRAESGCPSRCAGNRNARLLTARELMREMVEPLGLADLIEGKSGDVARMVAPGDVAQFGRAERWGHEFAGDDCVLSHPIVQLGA